MTTAITKDAAIERDEESPLAGMSYTVTDCPHREPEDSPFYVCNACTSGESQPPAASRNFFVEGDGFRASELYEVGARYAIATEGFDKLPVGAIGVVTDIYDGTANDEDIDDTYIELRFPTGFARFTATHAADDLVRPYECEECDEYWWHPTAIAEGGASERLCPSCMMAEVSMMTGM